MTAVNVLCERIRTVSIGAAAGWLRGRGDRPCSESGNWLADPPLNQRIKQPERFLTERPDIRIIEVPAPFLDSASDPHQRLVLQRLRRRMAALLDRLQDQSEDAAGYGIDGGPPPEGRRVS
jgi:hypothetical protein